MPKLKSYEESQALKTIREAPDPTGVACTETKCKGEMMWMKPREVHYQFGRAGEPDAVKSGMFRAVCGECGWRGWV